MTFKPPRFFGLMGSIIIAAASVSASLGASAQPAPADPPGRVARLSDLNGQVWLYSPDSAEWVSADRNRPLTSGDRSVNFFPLKCWNIPFSICSSDWRTIFSPVI